jgi:hypothetical protein
VRAPKWTKVAPGHYRALFLGQKLEVVSAARPRSGVRCWCLFVDDVNEGWRYTMGSAQEVAVCLVTRAAIARAVVTFLHAGAVAPAASWRALRPFISGVDL